MRYCKFIFVIYVLLGSFLMVACSQDEDAKLAVNSNILKIEVVDSSIQQNGNVSRAVTDVTYKTTFSDGDAIGIFAVNSDKEVFIKNVLATYNDGIWGIDGGRLSCTGDKGWTDMEVEGILSGQLLNNRLLINGNFGYRDNPMANTNFVGDFEAEWLITRSGDIRLKAYNETNDRYYTKTNLTTQGVGIMYKKDFNKWSDLYFWNKWRLRNKRKREEAEKVKPQQTDSITDKTAKSAVKRKRVQEQ
jgi:hypothetical protein